MYYTLILHPFPPCTPLNLFLRYTRTIIHTNPPVMYIVEVIIVLYHLKNNLPRGKFHSFTRNWSIFRDSCIDGNPLWNSGLTLV